MPIPQGKSGVTALHRTVKIIPVIQKTQLNFRRFSNIQMLNVLSGLQQT